MSAALVRVVEIKLKRMDWPTLQSFFCKTILDSLKTHFCSLLYKFTLYFRREHSFQGG
jgi:hypothetical protein